MPEPTPDPSRGLARPARRGRALTAIAVAGVLVALAAGCGSNDDSAHNARWARRFCTSLDTWQQATTSSSQALQAYLKTPNLDTTQAKGRLTEYLQGAAQSADRLARELRQAGTPAIDARRRAAKTLHDGSAAVQAAIADARAAVDALPVDDGAAFQTGIQTANRRLSAGFASFGNALDRVNRLDADGELVRAERSVRACRPLLSR